MIFVIISLMSQTPSKKIRRARKGKVIAGVAQGMANFFGIDVVWMRLLWVFAFIPGGLPGLIPYVLCWLIIPEEE
jgi:phage shock protein C